MVMKREFDLQQLSVSELRQLRDEAREQLRRRQFQRDWEASWGDLRGRVIDREESIEAILANPTEEERQRWAGKSPEEIRDDINRYLDGKEDEHIEGMKLVAEVDGISREIHIEASPRLARYGRRR